MFDFLQPAADKFLPGLLAWVAILGTVWISSPWIRNAAAAILWQLYELLIGKPS